MVKVPEGIQTIPVGAQRSFDVPVGSVAQKPEAHSALAVQAAPRLPMQAPATTV
jgi:hypothetical protein